MSLRHELAGLASVSHGQFVAGEQAVATALAEQRGVADCVPWEAVTPRETVVVEAGEVPERLA
jgi:hypothetical protein